MMKEPNRLSQISTKDNIQFKYNYEVMNACFDRKYTTSFDDATMSTDDGCLAWFPKAQYKDRNGNWKPGSNRVNWKNEVMPNGDIRQWLDKDEFPTNNSEEITFDYNQIPMHCFMQDSHNGQDYKYVGTVIGDSNSSTMRNRICRKIGDDIDLSVWYNHRDFSYYDREVTGYDYLKNVYIGHSYEIQKKYEDSFRSRLEEIENDNKTFEDKQKAFSEKFPAAKIPKTDGEYEKVFVPNFCYEIGILFNIFISPQDLNPGLSINDKGGAIFEIISAKIPLDGEVNRHNGIARHSIFGEEIAGILLAAYNPDYYIYSLTEKETEYYLKKLGVSFSSDDDLTEKHCLLQFWKQCNPTMFEWTNYMFYRFLEMTFGNPFKSSASERDALNDFSPYTFSEWLDEKKAVSLVRDKDGRAFVRKISDSDNFSVIERIKQLDVDGIPHIYDLKKVGRYIISIEEYIDRGTLDDLLAKRGVLPEDEVIKIGIRLCDILDQLHNQAPPIIHKDVKPANIAFRKNGQVVLLDFNISREYKTESSEDTMVAGTMSFAAPEQQREGTQTDERTDIFSVGETMYYMLTKSHNIDRIGAGKLKKIIEKCTDYNPNNRFQTAKELKGKLLELE